MFARKSSRRTFVVVVAGILLLGVLAPSASAQTSPAGCQSVRIPVRLGADLPADQTISGTLCAPLDGASSEVDVLTAGASYNSSYWDWPVESAQPSYVDRTRKAGRATFAYDRIGTGASSHPPSTSITSRREADVLHQIVTWLRGTHDFQHVTLIGHSYGSVISIEAAGTYQDVDRLVVTGLAHVPNAGAGLPGAIVSLLHPAVLDPQFRDSGLDPGYVTTTPDTRDWLFYSDSADPDLVAYDEAHKDVISLTAVTSVSNTLALPPLLNTSNRVDVPVLLVMGQHDVPFCTVQDALACANDESLRTLEAPYYTSAPSLSAVTVPATGHNLPMHPSADISFDSIDAWITSHQGGSGAESR